MLLSVFSVISTLEIFTWFSPIIDVTSPSLPGWSGSEIHSVVLYFFTLSAFLFSLYCQYLRIEALAFPVLVDDNQCNDGETFFDAIIFTTSPFVKVDCNGLSFPLISHPIAVSPIWVWTA